MIAPSSSFSSAVRICPTTPSITHFLLRPPPPLPSPSSAARHYSQQRADNSLPEESQHSPPSIPSSSSSLSSSSPSEGAKNLFSPHWHRLSSTIAAQRSQLSPKLRSELTRLGERWNMYSGYDQIESAKSRVIDSEDRLEALRSAQNQAKTRYVSAVMRRSTSQKTINDLLSRKASWSDEDLVKYTSLLRAEHAEAREEEVAREEFDAAERDVGKAWDEVVKRTLERYHDEQIWSDRVRNVSSCTQLAAVGLNVFIFALAILLVEPYKRRKLAETFETRLIKGEEQGRLALEAVMHRFDQSVRSMSEGLQDLKSDQKALLALAGVRQDRGGEDRGGAGVGAERTNQVVTEEMTRQSFEPTSSSDSPHLQTIQDGQHSSASESVEDQPPHQLLMAKAKERTRFLHSPRTSEEQERRKEVVVATGVGAILASLFWAGVSRAS